MRKKTHTDIKIALIVV